MPFGTPVSDTYGSVNEALLDHAATGIRIRVIVAGDSPVSDRNTAFQAVIDDLAAAGYTFIGAQQIYSTSAPVTPTP